MTRLSIILASLALLSLPMDAFCQLNQQNKLNYDTDENHKDVTNDSADQTNMTPFYNNGYNLGYNKGYNPGYNNGYGPGYNGAANGGGANSLPAR
jgi:hypothetical protein